MRVLLVDAYATGDPDAVAATHAADTLRARGHDVEHVSLAAIGFDPFMSAAERAAYHDDDNLLGDHTRQSAAAVRAADALLFAYPTTTFSVPARLKGWLDRVLVPGVAFVFDRKGRVARGMPNIRRLGVVTTTPHDAATTRRARDLGRRTLLWTLRLSCHRFCRRTFVRLPAGRVDPARIERSLNRW